MLKKCAFTSVVFEVFHLWFIFWVIELEFTVSNLITFSIIGLYPLFLGYSTGRLQGWKDNFECLKELPGKPLRVYRMSISSDSPICSLQELGEPKLASKLLRKEIPQDQPHPYDQLRNNFLWN